MAFKVANTKEECFEQLKELIVAFNKEYAIYKTSKYSEAQLRIDFLNPLLKTFGWDVDNENRKSQFLRDVLQEESIDVKEEDTITKKKPDYTLNIRGDRKVFVEAKQVSVNIGKAKEPAFQVRRYGWNANLGISILTNFEFIIVYDCRYKPDINDDANIARYQSFHVSEFIGKFDELYNLLSYQSISKGFIDEFFVVSKPDTTKFDDYFLQQIESWRQMLANEVITNNEGFNNEDINFLIQRLLNRIVFLRICEDREIEKFETLKNITSYDDLKKLFIESDKKYNSGLFDFIEDNFSLNINLHSDTLIGIFNELYYPQSPYNFSVVDPAILSQIYERYLGSRIEIDADKQISIVEEPEVSASSGVVPTPKLIVQNIVRETLAPIFELKNSEQIKSLKLADICCGSGTFLISIYDFLFEKITIAFVNEGNLDAEYIYQKFDGTFQLTLKAKQLILTSCIYGVDINPYAVEVSKFSLLLKILEDENKGTINDYLIKYKQKVLPNLNDNIKCGNSLIDNSYFDFQAEALNDDELLFKLKPFNFIDEFPFLNESKGFDAIVGNPPYVQIQNIVKYSKEEIKYYQSSSSGYTVSSKDTFDKYYLFIQRSINLLNENGTLGYIVPHKFFIVKGGKELRSFIIEQSFIHKIIHFGVSQVFPNRSTYTAILVLGKKESEGILFKRIRNISAELNSELSGYEVYNQKSLSEQPWVFVSNETQTVFDKIKACNNSPLSTIAEIAVGLQTSADKIYIFQPTSESDTTYKFTFSNNEYEIEKSICKPCIYDLSFDLFDTLKPNAQIIFPYAIQADKAEVFPEDYFQANYPLTWAYLNNFKAELSKRSINGSKEPKWYQYGRSQSLTRFHNTDKLIWPVLSTHPSYVFDEANLQFTGGGNGPYYSLFMRADNDYSIFYILGILAHPIFETMVKSGASEFRGAYYSHGKQFLENMPIKQIDFSNKEELKQHNEIVKTVKQLIATKESLRGEYQVAKKNVLKRKFDMLYNSLIAHINLLYSITDDEMGIVLNDEMLNDQIDED